MTLVLKKHKNAYSLSTKTLVWLTSVNLISLEHSGTSSARWEIHVLILSRRRRSTTTATFLCLHIIWIMYVTPTKVQLFNHQGTQHRFGISVLFSQSYIVSAAPSLHPYHVKSLLCYLNFYSLNATKAQLQETDSETQWHTARPRTKCRASGGFELML